MMTNQNDLLERLRSVGMEQWSMVTTPQAEAIGVSRTQLSRYADKGLITRLTYGVYLIGTDPLDVYGEIRAAWLSVDTRRTLKERIDSTDPGAVAIGSTAAYLHNIIDVRPEYFEFGTLTKRKSQRAGLYRCYLRSIEPINVIVLHGIPTIKLGLIL